MYPVPHDASLVPLAFQTWPAQKATPSPQKRTTEQSLMLCAQLTISVCQTGSK